MLRVNLRERGDNIGQELVVSQFNDEHNHPINPCLAVHHAKKRKLDAATEKEAANSLMLQANKKLLLQKLRNKTGKKVILKDLSNIQQKNKVQAH